MKTKLMIVVVAMLTLALLSLAQSTTPTQQKFKASDSAASQTKAAQKWHLPAGFSADDAYKANCTRCHAEVPVFSARRTRTVVQHMRVRGNLTKDEAEAILEYLTQ